MEAKNDSQEEVPSPTLQTLKTLERSWTGGSNDSVQQWIDSLNEADFVSALEERPITPNENNDNATGAFTDVSFLPLPGSQDDDELLLGADAKSLSRTSSCKGFSPRLSPLILEDSEPAYPLCNGSIDIDAIDEQKDGEDVEKCDQNSDGCSDSVISKDKENNKQIINSRSDSMGSLQDIPSLLAAMETDPEETLISLGFGQLSFASLLHRIPVRFLKHASEAKGIDTEKFYYDAVESEDKDSQSSYEDVSKRRLLSRFSQSSIDLSCVEYDDHSLTRRRRARMHEIIPSITIEPDCCDGSASEKNSPSRGSGNWRLSTVIEENEPSSRKSSFSKPDKRSPLQKQPNVDDASDWDQINKNPEQEVSGKPNGFSLDNTDITLQHTAARLEALMKKLDVAHVRKSDSDALNARKYMSDPRDENNGISNGTENKSNSEFADRNLYYRRTQSNNDEPTSSRSSLKVIIPAIDARNAESFGDSGLLQENSKVDRQKEEECNCDTNDDVFVDVSPRNFELNIEDPIDEMTGNSQIGTYCIDKGLEPNDSCNGPVNGCVENGLEIVSYCTKANEVMKNESGDFNSEERIFLQNDEKSTENKDFDFKFDTETTIESKNSIGNEIQKDNFGGLCEHDKQSETEKQTKNCFVQQFSEDSLEADDQKNSENNDESIKADMVIKECQGKILERDWNGESESNATRVVYRTVEKKEPLDVLRKNDNFMVGESDDNNNDEIVRKPRSWSHRLMTSLELKKSDNSKNRAVLKTDDSESNCVKTRAPSSGIRDYFRRLTTRRMQFSQSMDNISDGLNRNIKTQSLIDLSEKHMFSSEQTVHDIQHKNGDLNRDTQSNCGENQQQSNLKTKNRFISQSLQDIRRRSLELIPGRGSAFVDVERLKYLLKTGHRPPPEPRIPVEVDEPQISNEVDKPLIQSEVDEAQIQNEVDDADVRNCCKVKETGGRRDYHCDITAKNYRSIHGLGGGDHFNKGSSDGRFYLGHANEDSEKGLLDKEKLTNSNGFANGDTGEGSRNTYDCSAYAISGATRHCTGAMTNPDKTSPTEHLERFKPRMFAKGYSIESSGFEDEADGFHLLPDRGTSCAENGKRKFCSHCLQDRIEKPILEKSLSSSSAVSRDVSRDSLEQRSSTDENEVNGRRNQSVDLSKVNVPRNSTPVEVDHTWSDSSHFDFLVNQITALRKELSEQQERMEMYIDDRMERMKTSILTEISIMSASQKIPSPNASHTEE